MKDGCEKGKTKKKQNGTVATAPCPYNRVGFRCDGRYNRFYFPFIINLFAAGRDTRWGRWCSRWRKWWWSCDPWEDRIHGCGSSRQEERVWVWGPTGDKGRFIRAVRFMLESSVFLWTQHLFPSAVPIFCYSRKSRTRVLTLQRTRLERTGLACMDIYFNK